MAVRETVLDQNVETLPRPTLTGTSGETEGFDDDVLDDRLHGFQAELSVFRRRRL